MNAYLREIAGEEFTAKYFHTWAGIVRASLALQECEAFESEAQAKRNVTEMIKLVSQQIGNTPAICRKCYVYPAVPDLYLAGTLAKALAQKVSAAAQTPYALKAEEAAVMALLDRLARNRECLFAIGRPQQPSEGVNSSR